MAIEVLREHVIHIIIDVTTSKGYYHSITVANKVLNDLRVSEFKFKLKLHSREDIFIPEYLKCNKKTLEDFTGKKVLLPSFLKQINEGDIIIATGGNKIFNGLLEARKEKKKAFFYFGSTKKLAFSEQDKENFNLMALEHGSIMEEKGNIIPISEFGIFFEDFIKLEQEKKPEKDYIFLFLPYMTAEKKQKISFELNGAISAIKKVYRPGYKVIVLSNLINELEESIENEMKTLISDELKEKDLKIKFVHHDYIKENRIPKVLTHLLFNQNDKIIFSAKNFSEIYFFLNNGILKHNVLWFKKKVEKNPIFLEESGIFDQNLFEKLKSFLYFDESEVEYLKKYKSHEINEKNIANYIADEIINKYLQDIQDRKTKNEINEGEEVEEEPEIKETQEHEEEELEEDEGKDSEEREESEKPEDGELSKNEKINLKDDLNINENVELGENHSEKVDGGNSEPDTGEKFEASAKEPTVNKEGGGHLLNESFFESGPVKPDINIEEINPSSKNETSQLDLGDLLEIAENKQALEDLKIRKNIEEKGTDSEGYER